MEEEFELVPMSPIRKIEKRIDKLESFGLNNELVKELTEMTKTNQNIITDLTKINSEMITKVSELSSSVKNLMEKIEDFINRIEMPNSNESEGIIFNEEKKEKDYKTEKIKKIDERLDKLEKRINALLLYSMPKRKHSVVKPSSEIKPVYKKPSSEFGY